MSWRKPYFLFQTNDLWSLSFILKASFSWHQLGVITKCNMHSPSYECMKTFFGKIIVNTNILFSLHVFNVLNKLQHRQVYLARHLCFRDIILFFSLPVMRSFHTAENHQAMGNPWRGTETARKREYIWCCVLQIKNMAVT